VKGRQLPRSRAKAPTIRMSFTFCGLTSRKQVRMSVKVKSAEPDLAMFVRRITDDGGIMTKATQASGHVCSATRLDAED
jgi:hypothetical protein